MKKVLSLGILLLLVLFAGCSDSRDELYATIEAQAERIEQLSGLQQEHLDRIVELQREAEDETVQFWHGLSPEAVREDFFQNAEALVRNAVGEVRLDLGPLQEEDVALLISERFVYALVPAASVNQTLVILSYWRSWDEPHEIVWTVVAYGTPFFLDPFVELEHPFIVPAYIIPARELAEPRQLTDLETLTLPFFLAGWGYPEDDIEEVIQGWDLWEEAIRLVREHYGVQIRDIWYEGTTLYVELMPIMAGGFNVGFGSILQGEGVRQTFEAFPDATDVRFLVLGRRFTAGYNGFDINCICGGWAAALEIGIPPCTCIW